ncbi:MAG: SPOR domain-containing protein [Candidatus Fermentithermobacillus carboniphilus]|uniref:SPOR domain-containing protein n=1 Tax=Candidatus Fermentithermobacillus carboniphilus TaxID=3085328 RepID=A0AAT9L8V6_9FIRM|nr:MAG: SPOR domain-containing protein [Candidatus Fermentithermobacillus carboniphilus]
MRRTRMNRNRTLNTVVTFLIISLIFVGSGYLIGRFLLSSLFQRQPKGEPVSGNKDKTPAPSSYTAQIELKPLTIYRIQIGAYSSKENAEKTAEAAIAKGVSAFVMSPDPLYKVYCGVTGSKEAAAKISESVLPKLAGTVIAKDDKPYIATLEIPSRSFSITGDKAQVESIQKAVTSFVNALQSLVSFWDAHYLGQQSQVNLAAMESDIAALKNDLAKITPDANLKDAYETCISILSELEAAIRGAKEAQGGDSAKVTAGMTQLIKLVDTYNREIK